MIGFTLLGEIDKLLTERHYDPVVMIYFACFNHEMSTPILVFIAPCGLTMDQLVAQILRCLVSTAMSMNAMNAVR